MNKINTIMIDVKNTLYDDEKLSTTLLSLYKYLYKKISKYKDYYVQLKSFEKILLPILCNHLDYKERILFFIKASKIDIKDEKLKRFNHYMTSAAKNYIEKHLDECLEIIKCDEDIQQLYVNWFKDKEHNSNFKNSIYSEIFNLPKFKKHVLEDEKFILENLFSSIDFYEKLPKEYGYLVGLINAKNIPIKLTSNIYNKFFDGILKRSTQLKLLKAGIEMDNTDYTFGVDKKNKKLEFTNCLKKIYINKDYYTILKKLSKKTNLSLKYIISFADKYDNTNMFNELFKKKKFDENTIMKIKYLSISNKITNIDNINNLDEIQINELINIEKKDNVKVNLAGGPHSGGSINLRFSENSFPREARRINIDGSFVIKNLEFVGHTSGVNELYKELDSNIFDKSAFEIAIEAAKKLNSITFIIEGEACLIIMSSNVTKKQKYILIDWIKKSNENANICINIYNKENNKNEVLLCSEIDKNDIIEYINNLNFNEEDKKMIGNM